MTTLKSFCKKNNSIILFILILAIGITSRIIQFGNVPAGLHQDEAFAGYEAWSLLNYGIDSAGYHNPVYLTAWGSGMNALESYMMIPFIALFGLKTWAIRLPQLIIAILSLPCIYHTVYLLKDRKTALYTMFILAICPWHIMLSRWGLESNLLPGFMLFGFYFFIRGISDNRYFIVSAIMFGLSLYTYAVCWPFIPLFLAFSILYLFFIAEDKKNFFNKNTLFSVLILFFLALPLLLFLAVNYGFINEIKTAWISIPKLGYFRSAEMNLSDIFRNLKASLRIIIYGTDNIAYNSPKYLHLLYWPTLFFIIIGTIDCIKIFVVSVRTKKYDPTCFLMFWLVVAFCECATVVEANTNRINISFLPLIISAALGISTTFKILHYKHFEKIVICVYSLFFFSFEFYYFTDFQTATNEELAYGVIDAVQFANSNGEHIYIADNECIFYPEVLFALKYPTDQFIDSVKYKEYPAMYLKPISFGNITWGFDSGSIHENDAYIMDYTSFENCKSLFYEKEFSTKVLGKYVICYTQ